MPIRIDGTGYIGSANNIYTDGSGRVGIGTASPSHKLHVAGTYANGPSMDPGLGIENTAASRVFKIRVGDGGLFAINDTTAGADRVIVDTSGRVTMPYQPMCWLQHQTSVSYGVDQLIQFTAVYDPNSMFSGASNYRVTVPVAGRYMVIVDLLTNSNATTDMGVYIRKNGVSQRRIYTSITSGSFRPFSGSIILNCAASDYIDCISQLATTNIYGASGGGGISGMTVYLLG